jgi:hypothetical protein
MSEIYKDFAANLDALNATAFYPNSQLINGRRVYNVNNQPYFDLVHFEPNGDSLHALDQIQYHFMRRRYEGRVYAGAAGIVNLVNMAVSEAPAGILTDINPLQSEFWNHFITVLARHPDPHDCAREMVGFLPKFYETISEKFNISAVNNYNRELDIEPPNLEYPIFVDDDNCLRDDRQNWQQSPILNTTYADFANWFAMRAGFETQYHFTGDPALNILNPKLYSHLHLLAKNRAIGAVTLDICDSDSCTQLQEYLRNVSYTPLDLETGFSRTQQMGAQIGCLYLSNICHYIDPISYGPSYSPLTSDFTGRKLLGKEWGKVAKNLLPILSPDALVIRFDRIGVGDPFSPKFYPLFDSSDPETMQIPRPLEAGGLIADIR